MSTSWLSPIELAHSHRLRQKLTHVECIYINEMKSWLKRTCIVNTDYCSHKSHRYRLYCRNKYSTALQTRNVSCLCLIIEKNPLSLSLSLSLSDRDLNCYNCCLCLFCCCCYCCCYYCCCRRRRCCCCCCYHCTIFFFQNVQGAEIKLQ